jgi:hypothetical protein
LAIIPITAVGLMAGELLTSRMASLLREIQGHLPSQRSIRRVSVA